jgi:hypothetical protein
MLMTLNSAVAGEHQADLRRDAERMRARPAPAMPPAALDSDVTLRLSEISDSVSVHRLEALDETPALAGPTLLAVRGGEVVAALSLSDGRVAANPFVPSADAVALLRLRAEHVRVPRQSSWRRRRMPRRVRWA